MPTGVELVFPNGERRPLEIYYVGLEGKTHVWQVTAKIKMSEGGELRIKNKPANTAVDFVLDHS